MKATQAETINDPRVDSPCRSRRVSRDLHRLDGDAVSTIGERIRLARKKIPGLTQSALADGLAINTSAIGQWETDVTAPSLDRIAGLAERLNVPIAWLVTGEPEVRGAYAAPAARDSWVSPDKTDADILLKLADLHKQATTERSHYYVGAVTLAAFEEIVKLRMPVDWKPKAIAPRDRPIQTWDGHLQAVAEWDDKLQDFALSPVGIFDPDPADKSGVAHLIEWDFTHWHDLQESPK